MRIAIIGAGISGLVSAWLLGRDHEITVFEAGPRVGGHTHTVDVEQGGTRHAIDTGFIVFNRPNYPNFTRILDMLAVDTQPTDMSFGVQCARTGLEYCGSSLGRFFAQRRNLLRPRHYGLLREILAFNKAAPSLLEEEETDLTLGAYLTREHYSAALRDHYIVPMAAALWSGDPGRILDFPAWSFVEFFENHGFFRLQGRPEWLVVRGGSQRYVEKLSAPFQDHIRTETPVLGVRRHGERVEIRTERGGVESFDAAILAVHSDQALRMLSDPSADETAILGAIPYQANEAVLHGDPSVMPAARGAWASWNFHVPREPAPRPTVTYHMNSLQGLPEAPAFFVSLNRGHDIDPSHVHRRIPYHHPVFTLAARKAQAARHRVQGQRSTWFAGAYWGYGFHEDGVRSALEVCADFGVGLS